MDAYTIRFQKENEVGNNRITYLSKVSQNLLSTARSRCRLFCESRSSVTDQRSTLESNFSSLKHK